MTTAFKWQKSLVLKDTVLTYNCIMISQTRLLEYRMCLKCYFYNNSYSYFKKGCRKNCARDNPER